MTPLSWAAPKRKALEPLRKAYTHAAWLVNCDALVPGHRVLPNRSTLIGQVLDIQLRSPSLSLNPK